MLPAICVVTVPLCFFALAFYALHRKRHVRATFKIPFAKVEFEANDESREGDTDPNRE